MKTLKSINLILWVVSLLFVVVSLSGCTAAEFQSTVQDANSPFQVAADSTGTILESLKPLSPVVAAIPYGQYILSVFAVLSALANGIQKLRINRQQAVIVQTVKAVEDFKAKADESAVEVLKTALANAQSPESKVVCYAIRQSV